MDSNFLKKFKGKCPLYAPRFSIRSLFFNRVAISKGELESLFNNIETKLVYLENGQNYII